MKNVYKFILGLGLIINLGSFTPAMAMTPLTANQLDGVSLLLKMLGVDDQTILIVKALLGEDIASKSSESATTTLSTNATTTMAKTTTTSSATVATPVASTASVASTQSTSNSSALTFKVKSREYGSKTEVELPIDNFKVGYQDELTISLDTCSIKGNDPITISVTQNGREVRKFTIANGMDCSQNMYVGIGFDSRNPNTNTYTVAGGGNSYTITYSVK
jgi:hypothetical protein